MFNINDKFGSPFSGQAGGQNISNIMGVIVTGSVVLAGLVVLFLFIFAGYSIIMGAGSGNSDQSAKGKKAATYAVLGFFIVFLAYWVIRFIEIIVDVDFVSAPGI